jgi:hypothetical protein
MQQMTRCANCGSPNPPNRKFCIGCGAPIVGNGCPNCGTPLNPSERFCGGSGAPVSQIGGYKQPNVNPGPAQSYGNQQAWGQPQQQWGGQPAGYQGYSQPAKGPSAMPLVFLLIILLAGLGGFAYWAFAIQPQSQSQQQTQTQPTTTATSTNIPVQITMAPIVTLTSTNSVKIHWETAQLCTGKLDWGSTTAYTGSTGWETNLTKTHDINLTSLAPGSSYHYRITNKDSQSLETQSSDYSFRVPAVETPAP